MKTARRLAAVLCVVGSVAGVAFAGRSEGALAFARKTLTFVERSASRGKLAAELKALEKRFADAKAARKLDDNAMYASARNLRRRIIFSHPLLDFERLLINRRTGQTPGHMCDQYYGRHSRPGPGLTVLESWKDKPRPRPLLAEGALPAGMTHHPDLSFDAKRVLLAFCDLSTRKDGKARSFFIYEAEVKSGKVRQLTGTKRDGFAGWRGRQTVLIEDWDPCYLPDGGLAFISTRSQQFGRCHGSRYVPAYVLYRADADGSNIKQLSYNEANEWDPAVLHDGRIVYTRWDYINRHDTNFQSVWVIHPDGTGTAHFYGNNSVGPCMIAEAHAIPNSHKVVATATDHHGYTAGSIIVIDPHKGQDGGAPLTAITPEIGFPERRPPAGTTMLPRPAEPLRGRAATPLPISEDLFFVAAAGGGRGGKYAIYLIDTLGGRELIYEDPKISCFAPIPLKPTPVPRTVPQVTYGPDDAKTGMFYVQDVYRSAQPIERGTIKAMRISQIISQPTRSKPRLSRVDNEIVKRILGTVPVDPDGSVFFEAPAKTPMQFQILDANGMAVMTMRSLVYVQPGEVAGCVGCHEPREQSPRFDKRVLKARIRKIAPPAGPRYEGGFSFARTVQPVLDRYCIRCHGLGKTEGRMNLLGTRTGSHSAAYDSLTGRGGLVALAHRNSERFPSKPKDYFAHAGRLAKHLLDGHKDKEGKPRVRLDRESLGRIIDWLDLNGQYYGDYSHNRAERRGPTGQGAKALQKRIGELFGSEIAAQPIDALVNVAMPTESRILKAPLAVKAGGWGQITRNAWASTNDPRYQEVLKLIRASLSPMGRQDMAGTCGSESGGRGCSCGCCWVRQVRAARRNRKPD